MDYPINFADQLAQHLKAFRKSRGLTQAQLAKHLGVAQSRIADIETNPGKVGLENLLKVLAVLDVRVVLRDGAVNAAPQTVFYVNESKPTTLAELKDRQNQQTPEGEDW